MEQEVLISGKAPFKIEVPYKLIETGEEGPKPLIVYLHGFRQNIEIFRRQVSDLLDIEAYHLFLQGPYPIYERAGKRQVEDWGRAWYLYDGDQTQFEKSMELSSEFIQEIIDHILNRIDDTRICVLGYSMGAYLAGYFALSRWKDVNDLIMIGGRLKTELFEDQERNYGDLNVLALHGKNDGTVQSKSQRECINVLGNWGADITFRELNEGHKLTSAFPEAVKRWLDTIGYVRS